MSRRKSLLIAVSISCGLVLAVACSFPDVTFRDGASPDGSGGEAGSSGSSGSSGGASDASTEETPVLVDGSDPDALIANDSGREVDAAGCTATNCDCDGDDAGDTSKAACTGSPGIGADCDNLDSRSRPNQTAFLDAIPPATQKKFGDWNCDDTVEKLFKPNFTCPALLQLGSCSDLSGFTDDPDCGKTGSFIVCKTGAILTECVAGPADTTRKQACR